MPWKTGFPWVLTNMVWSSPVLGHWRIHLMCNVQKWGLNRLLCSTDHFGKRRPWLFSWFHRIFITCLLWEALGIKGFPEAALSRVQGALCYCKQSKPCKWVCSKTTAYLKRLVSSFLSPLDFWTFRTCCVLWGLAVATGSRFLLTIVEVADWVNLDGMSLQEPEL